MQTKEWVSIHRKHHAKCETTEDPHSPQTRGIKAVLWTGAELYKAEAENQETLSRYGHGTPNDWIERNLYSKYTWEGVGLMLGADLILFGAAGLAVWAVQMMWIPFFAAGVINGIGHYWGYRNYDTPDASNNISPWGVLIGGESCTTTPHAPDVGQFSLRWFEFDLGWTYIRALQAVGLAKVLRVAPVPKVAEPKRSVDLETLQALIANRYDLLAKYARNLKQAYHDEISSRPAGGRKGAPASSASCAGDVTTLPTEQQRSLSDLMAHSGVMRRWSKCAPSWHRHGRRTRRPASRCWRIYKTGSRAPKRAGSQRSSRPRCVSAVIGP
jgi:stearoyl-CoA desaturase (delta-9 desaturase)